MKLSRMAGLFCGLLCMAATPLSAQDVASSFEQLAVLVKPGDRISLVDVSGGRAEGRLASLSRQMLTLDTSDGPRQLGESDVAEIRQRRDDSLLNGAIIGAVVSAAYFTTLAAILSDSDGGDVIISSAISGGVLFAAMGAGAGAGIDAMIRRKQVIYRKAGARTIGIAPILGAGRRGAVVTVKF